LSQLGGSELLVTRSWCVRQSKRSPEGARQFAVDSGRMELYGRLSEGATDRERLVDQVEKKEYQAVVKEAGAGRRS